MSYRRQAADVTHYAILCLYNGASFFAERSLEDASNLENVISDVMGLQVEGVSRIFAFNTVEGWSQDVTEEVAVAIANRFQSETIHPEIFNFIETHAGAEYARGLRAFDRTFAA